MVFLAVPCMGGGICASGKLVLADISTWSTSESLSGNALCVPSQNTCKAICLAFQVIFLILLVDNAYRLSMYLESMQPYFDKIHIPERNHPDV